MSIEKGKKMKILNLYAGIGGNRMLWGNDHEITAIEFNKSVAECYKSFYPKDNVIVCDAHEYLLEHYHEFDFIWSSPPCQSHSQVRQIVAKSYWENLDKPKMSGNKPIYPDMKLWQEIIFLQHHAKCNWVIENVKPYYKPFLQPSFTLGKHLYWSNKFILSPKLEGYRGHKLTNEELEKLKNVDLSGFKFDGIDKRQVLRNMVEPEDGLIVFDLINNNL